MNSKQLMVGLLLLSATGTSTPAGAAQLMYASVPAQDAAPTYNFSKYYYEGNWSYYLDEQYKVARLVSCNEQASSITIPPYVTYKGEQFTVVSIGNNDHSNVFYYGVDIESITLPSTLTEIYNYAFQSTNIKSMTLPEKVVSIGDYAFSGCKSLSNITFHTGLASIGILAFYGCENLGSVTLPSTLQIIGEGAFLKTGLTTLTIPAGVTTIGSNAAPEYLKKLTMLGSTPPTLEGNVASYLNSVYVPKGSASKYRVADYWKNYVIVDGDGLALNIKVDKAGTLGDKILAQTVDFVDVNKLTISGTLNSDDLYNITNRLTSLIEIDLSATDLTTLPNSMFQNRKAIQKIALPSNLQSIGSGAMYSCDDLNNVIFPSTLKSIGSGAFSGCNAITEVVLPEGFEKIGSSAFDGCNSLKVVTLPSTLKEVGGFSNCRALETISIPEGVTKISNDAFSGDKHLKTISLPSTLIEIGNNAFFSCEALNKLTIPAGVVNCEDAFNGCSSLAELTCEALLSPYVSDRNPLVNVTMDNRTLYVPTVSAATYKQAKGWDAFPNIKGKDILPAEINVWKPFTLTLPDNLKSDYKPDVQISIMYDLDWTRTGTLTIEGKSMFSMKSFNMLYNEYNYIANPNNLNPFYTSLISNAPMRADKASVTLQNAKNTWIFFIPPFDVNMADITTDDKTSWVVRSYSGANRAAGKTDQTWINVGKNETLKAGRGYIMSSTGGENNSYNTFIMPAADNANKNLIFANTARSITLTEYPAEFAHNRSWNLVGNPYPAFYDTRYMQFTAPITVYNEYERTYEAYSPVDDSFILRPGEAFFVQKPDKVAAIVFPIEGRQTDRNVREKETSPARLKANAKREVFNLSVTNGELSDKTRFVINPAASAYYTLSSDAGKFMSLDKTVPQLYTLKNGTPMAINERPEGNGIIDLGFYAGVEADYTLALNSTTLRTVTLVDKLTNTETELDQATYTFHAGQGTYETRFYVKLGGVSAIQNAALNETDVDVKVEGHTITVAATRPVNVQIISIDGKTVKAGNGTEVKATVAMGIYIVKAGSHTHKVTITR